MIGRVFRGPAREGKAGRESAVPPSAQAAAAALEGLLARLYVDAAVRAQFLEDPAGVAKSAGLGPDDVEAVVAIDRGALAAAATSFAQKHAAKSRR